MFRMAALHEIDIANEGVHRVQYIYTGFLATTLTREL